MNTGEQITDTTGTRTENKETMEPNSITKSKKLSTRKKDDPSFHAGYLQKRGDKVKKWKERYFKTDLKYHTLIYGAEDPFGVFSQNGLIPLIDATISLGSNDAYERDNVFLITPKDSTRVFVLQAPTREKMELWVAALKLHVNMTIPIIKTGYLKKLGEANKSLKERYIILTSINLQYYKKEGDTNAAGIIELDKNVDIIQESNDDWDNISGYLFSVSAADALRKYVFSCQTAKERSEWMRALLKLFDPKSAMPPPSKKKVPKLIVSSDSHSKWEQQQKTTKEMESRDNTMKRMARKEHMKRSVELKEWSREEYLWKLGGKMKTWKQRFFKINIQRGTLEYLGEDSFGINSVLGSIQLAGATLTKSFPPKSYGGRKNVFGITPCGGEDSRTYILQAPSPESRDLWLDILGKYAERENRNEQEEPIFEGYLKKQGEINTSWKIRYFRLYSKQLEYFKNDKEKKPSGNIPFSGGCDLSCSASVTYGLELAPDTAVRTFVLQAEDENDRSEWMDILSDVIKKHRSRQSVPFITQEYEKKEVTLEGNLFKMGSKNKSWRRRWFILSGQRIKYYKRALRQSAKLEKQDIEFLERVKSEAGSLVQDRTWHLQKYTKCFIGSELVTWMVEQKIVDSREAAVARGKEIQKRGGFDHVTSDHLFEDGEYFYRFRENELNQFTTPMGQIVLRRGAEIKKVAETTHDKKHCFSIHPTGNKRMFILSATSEQEMDKWISAISVAIDPDALPVY